MRRIWFATLLVGIMVLAIVEMGTVAYFRDVERSVGNVFQAGVWRTQADDLMIDIGSSFLSGIRLHNVIVSNIGDSEIVIIKLEISWEPDKGENVTKVWVVGQQPAKVWEGNERSGIILDIKDCVLIPGDKNDFEFLFDSKMEGKEFTIRFLMEDGSSKLVEFKPIIVAENNNEENE